MGLIKVNDEQKEFREYFTGNISKDILACQGIKYKKGLFSIKETSNHIINPGNGLYLNYGQCVIIVDEDRIFEIQTEPGTYEFEADDEHKKGKVYYLNTTEITDNMFGTKKDIVYFDEKTNNEVALRCAGTYSYIIYDPVLFFMNMNQEPIIFLRKFISESLKKQFLEALSPALQQLSNQNISLELILPDGSFLLDEMKIQLDELWSQRRGIHLTDVSISTLTFKN